MPPGPASGLVVGAKIMRRKEDERRAIEDLHPHYDFTVLYPKTQPEKPSKRFRAPELRSPNCQSVTDESIAFTTVRSVPVSPT